MCTVADRYVHSYFSRNNTVEPGINNYRELAKVLWTLRVLENIADCPLVREIHTDHLSRGIPVNSLLNNNIIVLLLAIFGRLSCTLSFANLVAYNTIMIVQWVL